METSPRVYMVWDNCSVIKRFVKPSEWLEIAKELGFNYVQASTDNEIDPLFSSEDYMDEWFSEAKKAQEKTGVKIINFYTGYQTYRTVGFGHFYPPMAEYLRDNWAKKLMLRAADLGSAGIGFSFFAVPDSAIQNPDKFYELEARMIEIMRDLGEYAVDLGIDLSMEQMYVPYQPPFTIAQAEDYLKRCYTPGKRLSYITLDTGHMIGQSRFLKPTVEKIERSFQEPYPAIWLGADAAYELWAFYKEKGDFKKGAAEIEKVISDYPYLFTEEQDADEFEWFKRLAKYSPIVHMQQTDGITAGHASFTAEKNKNGIITGKNLFSAINDCYSNTNDIIPRTENIYLSFELFYSNMATKTEIFSKLKESLKYWRQFVPYDGISLNDIMLNL